MNKILNEAAKSVGLLSQAKIIFLMDPMLEQVATRFADYVGSQSITSTKKSLLNAGIKDAITRYNALSEDSPKEAISAFAVSLITHGAEVFSQRIYVKTPQGEIMWSPFVSGLVEFLANYPDHEVLAERAECKYEDQMVKTLVMTKIFPLSWLDHDSLSEILLGFNARA